MKRNLFIVAFTLTVICTSCSKEQKIDRLLDKVENLIEDEDAFNRESRLETLGTELQSFKEEDFTPSQQKRLFKLVNKYNQW